MSTAAERRAAPVAGRDMIWIPGGRFMMGSDDHYPEERPARAVQVDGFWMDRALVTNADFAAFVEATGYRTVAEVAPRAEDYPGALIEQLVAASLVFEPPLGPIDPKGPASQWWNFLPGADWRHPTGPESSIDACMDHPVVHVALDDVEAYMAWAEVSLPTEAEWEFAARGGIDGAEFAWGGDSLVPNGVHQANVWQGPFPYANALDDGWYRTSPVATFPPNGYGLYDLIGNVWEWTSDWWALPNAGQRSCCATVNPRNAESHLSIAIGDPAAIPRRVLKGGSHLCAPSYCRRYRPAARHPHPVDTSTSHVGFRCILRPAS